MKKKLLVSMILALTAGMALAQGQDQVPGQGQGQLSTTVLTTTTATGEVRTTILKSRVPAAKRAR